MPDGTPRPPRVPRGVHLPALRDCDPSTQLCHPQLFRPTPRQAPSWQSTTAARTPKAPGPPRLPPVPGWALAAKRPCRERALTAGVYTLPSSFNLGPILAPPRHSLRPRGGGRRDRARWLRNICTKTSVRKSMIFERRAKWLRNICTKMTVRKSMMFERSEWDHGDKLRMGSCSAH